MLEQFKNILLQYLYDYKIRLEDSSFLLSFSGGIDSTTMASLLLKMRGEYSFKLGLMHFNHHSHYKSDSIENFCLNYSLDNNVRLHQHDLFFESNSNFEALARERRYLILNDISHQYNYQFILTAHHRDDQLETLYMKQMDNGDWISKVGIREKMGKLRRPFLNITKNRIMIYAKTNNINCIADPSNLDLTMRRNKIRHKELPNALKKNVNLKNDLLNSSQNSLDKLGMARKKLKNDYDNILKRIKRDHLQINRNLLQEYTLEELKLFIYCSIASALKIKLKQQTGGLWAQFKNFINKSKTGSIFEIDTLTFLINRNEIIVVQNYEKLTTTKTIRLINNCLWCSGKFKIDIPTMKSLSSSKTTFIVPSNMYNDGLYIRSWKYGDQIISSTSKKHILVSDLYINNKLSQYQKKTQPVVVNNNDMICWIPGLIHGMINFHNKHYITSINWTEN